MRIIGYRELLCDGCNLRFKGFVLPGTLPRSGRGKSEPPRKSETSKPARTVDAAKPLNISSGKRCPGCGGDRTHRSHRRGIAERLASVFTVYPHRCDDCNKRFLARRPANP